MEEQPNNDTAQSARSTDSLNVDGSHPQVFSFQRNNTSLTTAFPFASLVAGSSVPVVLPLDAVLPAMSHSDRELFHQQVPRLLRQSASQNTTRPISQNEQMPSLNPSLVTPGIQTNVPRTDVVLDISSFGTPTNPQGSAQTQHTHSHQHEHQHNVPSRGGTRRSRPLSDQLQGIPGLGPLIQNLQGAVPFLILLFAKVMYNHRLGLLVFAAMFGTFHYANSYFKRLVSLRDNQTWSEALSGYIWIFGFLASNIIFIYFVFDEQKLYYCLYFQRADIDELDLWNLLWIAIITDFIVKFGTIAVKSLVAVLPKHILPHKKKGKYFLLLEMISQFYRCVIPVKNWTVFMLEDRYGGEWMALMLFLIYIVVKALHLRKKFYELKKAVAHCRVDTPFGTSPNREELKAFENTCPICQDNFSDPVKLTCKHVFCDDCICLWLDREKTCPMCRAHIVDNPVWRDGATSAIVQFY